MARSLLVAAGLISFLSPVMAQTSAPPLAVPTSSLSYALPPQPSQILLSVESNPPLLAPLTPEASDPRNIPTNKSSDTGLGMNIVHISPSSSFNFTGSDQVIAYISCDSSVYNGNIDLNTLVTNSINSNASAILFYSTDQNYCNVTGPAPNNFQLLYTMTDSADANNLQILLDSGEPEPAGSAHIISFQALENLSEEQNSNGPSPSTAVAMIILYSITGVITALFLVIIITGAVRAHRHPERYGPRNIIGRTRQSRAKGIARAMLDTIPIVKFGEREDEKPADVELAQRSNQDATREGAESSTDGKGSGAAATGEEIETTHNKDNTGVTTTESENKTEDNADSGLGCSICTEDFEKGEDLRVLPCNHKFHPACVDPWLLDVSGTCPLCRIDLRPPEERESEENADGTAENQTANDVDTGLPPPLNAQATGNSTRRRNIRNFLDVRRLGHLTREERILALRRWRQTQTQRSRQSRVVSSVEGPNAEGPISPVSPMSPEDATEQSGSQTHASEQASAADDPVGRLTRIRRSIFRG